MPGETETDGTSRRNRRIEFVPNQIGVECQAALKNIDTNLLLFWLLLRTLIAARFRFGLEDIFVIAQMHASTEKIPVAPFVAGQSALHWRKASGGEEVKPSLRDGRFHEPTRSVTTWCDSGTFVTISK